jgi:hypothetical protein
MMFIPWIIRALVGRGIAQGTAERVAKPLLYLIALIALAGLCWAAIARHDSNVIVKHDATANAQVIAKTTPANDRAADQRAADTIAITRTEQGAHDAIAKAPESAPSPAAVVLNCRRLRLAGKDTSHLAACAGH